VILSTTTYPRPVILFYVSLYVFVLSRVRTQNRVPLWRDTLYKPGDRSVGSATVGTWTKALPAAAA
jgi:hypothetical protein